MATSALKKELAEGGAANVRPSYLGVLLSLWGEDALRSVELGRRAGLEPSSMTGVLDRMQHDGLIRREADPKDRRAQRIYLTSHGRDIEAAVRKVVNRMLERMTAGICSEDMETTKATLHKLLHLAQKERTL